MIDIEYSKDNIKLIPKLQRFNIILSKHFKNDENVIDIY